MVTIKKKIKYFSESLETLEDDSYDVIVSKDVFEHVIGLKELYPVLIKKLKPGGRLLLGFGLYGIQRLGIMGYRNEFLVLRYLGYIY